jgi:hypothetical protein
MVSLRREEARAGRGQHAQGSREFVGQQKHRRRFAAGADEGHDFAGMDV